MQETKVILILNKIIEIIYIFGSLPKLYYCHDGLVKKPSKKTTKKT